MNRYIEAEPSVSAVQFWNNEKCMAELKELGINEVDLRFADGATKMVVTNPLMGETEANEGDYIVTVDGIIFFVFPQADFEAKYRPYETDEDSTDSNRADANEPPAPDYPDNRLLNAFARPDALNEIYATGDVDHRGVPVNYSIWRGNHSIMGMTGILFQKGFVAEGDYQEGVEDIDLLEMVHDRLSILADYLEGTDDCMIDTAMLNIELAIGNLVTYANRCREAAESRESSDY